MQLETLPDNWMQATQRSKLRLYSLYRLAIATVLLLSQPLLFSAPVDLSASITLKVLIVYFIFGVGTFALSWIKQADVAISLPVQVVIDIGFLVLMMYLGGQEQSGFGLLLIITIVFASLISEGRYALFYAAIATIGILLAQTHTIITGHQGQNYANAVLLSLACFATAWLAYTLAKRMRNSDQLAAERSADINNLVKINALITQQMPNGVLVVDAEQKLLHYNPQFSQLTGISIHTLTDAIQQNKSLTQVTPALSGLLANWLQQDNRAQQADAIKFQLANKDIGIRFVSTAMHHQANIVIFVEDWSQMQTQSQQAKLAALGRLTANIAHEIRNPLSAISHASQLLQEDNHDASSLRMLNIIGDNVQRLDQIIKDILELNRRDRTNQETIQLNAFLYEFHQQFCAVEHLTPQDFMLNLDNNEIEIAFDKRHLNQILWNLCINGWRHSQQQHGSLKLSVNNHPQHIDIVVTDDGSGIALEIQSTLFEPFITTEKTGTGLGLYITKELSNANGADIHFISSEQGTRFTLSISKET